MIGITIRIAALTLAAGGAWMLALDAHAEYPERPIRFVVPAGAGDGPDVSARLLAAELVKQMGQQVVIDNRPGAAATIGTEAVARAAADGYTIGHGNIQSLAIARSVMPRLPYDVDKDLRMVVQAIFLPNLLAVTPSLPVKSVRELIDYAKTNPGKLLFGATNGSSSHLSGELFKLMTGTQMGFISYKTAQQSITDMIGGQVHVAFENMSAILPQVKAGRLRGLATTSPTRTPAVPDLPTVAEAGVPGFAVTAWSGLIVPAGVSRAIIDRLNAEVNKALTSPVLKEKYTSLGYETVGGTPEQFTNHVGKENAKWAEVAKRAGVNVE